MAEIDATSLRVAVRLMIDRRENLAAAAGRLRAGYATKQVTQELLDARNLAAGELDQASERVCAAELELQRAEDAEAAEEDLADAEARAPDRLETTIELPFGREA